MRAMASSGGRRPGGDLLEQRIVEAGDHGAGIGGAAVEADAEAGRAAIGGDAAVVGDEVLFGILGGDAALEGMAVEPDLALSRHAGALILADRGAVGDADLGLDDVDAGHLLGDGVLDLDAGIDLDEIEGAGVGVLEELDRAGAAVFGGMGDGDGVVAEFLALPRRKIRRRRPLDDFLVTPLDGAVALEEVDDRAEGIGENLDFDMARPLDEFLQIDVVLAEGGLGFAARAVRSRTSVASSGMTRMPRPPPPQDAFSMTRVADAPGLRLGDLDVGRKRVRRRHHRHADRDREIARRDLVAEHAHGVRRRSDEDDPRRGAGFREVGVFRQQPVAGMDRIGLRFAGDADDLGDRQIGLDRAETLADLVGFVGLEAVEGELVLFGEDRDRAHAQFIGRAEDADGDFGSIGDENFLDRQGSPVSLEETAERQALLGPLCNCETDCCDAQSRSPVAASLGVCRRNRLQTLRFRWRASCPKSLSMRSPAERPSRRRR